MVVDANGCVDSVVPRLKSIEIPAGGAVGNLTEHQEHSKEILHSPFNPQIKGDCIVHDLAAGRSASLRRRQGLAACSIKQNWQAKDEHWEWQLEIKHRRGQARELRVELLLPIPLYPGYTSSGHAHWHLWAPVYEAPFTADDFGIRTYHHCKCLDESTDLPLPLCSLYRKTENIDLGLAYLLPPSQMRYVDFCFNQREWLVKITFHNIALLEGETVKLSFWCFDHEGDWRPALGWVRKKFPSLLGGVKGQDKIDGNMAYTVPMIPEHRIKDWVEKMQLRWIELLHMGEFGDYAPAEPFAADHFKSKEHPDWTVEGITYDALNRYIDRCHKYGVNVMPYLNFSEVERSFANNFPESIVKVINGKELLTWHYRNGERQCVQMNADPQYPFFDFFITQYEILQKRCPGIDGFFFDQQCAGWIDIAHFDGETFYNNRPAYNLGNMYIRAMREIRKRFPRPKFIGMGNGIIRWHQMEFLDGAMAEGVPSTLGRVSFISPERPTMLLSEGEYTFQNALLYGASVHVSPYAYCPSEHKKPLPRNAVKLFEAYSPLFEFLKGRKWVYDPNPLAISYRAKDKYYAPLIHPCGDKIRGNIFETPWGDHVITVVAVPKGMMFKNYFMNGVSVRVKVRGANSSSRALIFGPDYKGYFACKPAMRNDGYLEINIPKHGAATMIVLTHDFTKLRKLRPWAKLKEPMLG